MMKSLKLALVFTGILFIASVVAMAAAAFPSRSPILQGFTEGCESQPQPCWYGIVPGITRKSEALAQLARYHLTVGEFSTYYGNYTVNETDRGCTITLEKPQDDVITELDFRKCEGLWFGDLAFLIQSRGSIYFEGCQGNSIHFYYSGSGLYIRVPDYNSDVPGIHGMFPVTEFILRAPKEWRPNYETADFHTYEPPRPSDQFLKHWRFLKIVDWTDGCG